MTPRLHGNCRPGHHTECRTRFAIEYGRDLRRRNYTSSPAELRATADGLLRRMAHVAETRSALLERAAAMELAGLGAETPSLWDEVRP